MSEQGPFRFGCFETIHAGHNEVELFLEGGEFGPLVVSGDTSIAGDGMTHIAIIMNKGLILHMDVNSN